MQKIIFILIAVIVHYIASGKVYYSLESEESLGCWQGNTKVGSIDPMRGVPGFSQNGSGLAVFSFRSEIVPYLREFPRQEGGQRSAKALLTGIPLLSFY